MPLALALILCASIAAPADGAVRGGSPGEEVRAALGDLLTLPPSERATARYLSLYNLPEEDWSDAAAVLSYTLNAVSRTARIVRPVVLCEGRLLRFDLRWYGLDPALWEALVSDREPYFHITTQVIPPGATAGATERLVSAANKGANNSASAANKPQTVYTDGGWIDLTAAAALRKESGSGGAVVRGDWFLARVTVPPHYYRFAGVPETEAEYLAALGLDAKRIGELRADEGANLFRSGVTRKLRRLVRRQGPLGGAWQTYDVATSRADQDPFRNLFNFRFDAGEHIAAKKNGLHLFALFDAAGKRQDTVPDRIAKDDSDPHGDGIIVPMISCVRCHVEDGLRPFVNDQRRLLEGRVELYADRPETAERLAAFYETNLGKRLIRDREDYAEAVAQATGDWGVGEMAAGMAEFYRRYVHESVTRVRAARELGLPEEQFVAALGTSTDPAVLALCEGLEVQREQWEESFGQAAILAEANRR